MEKQKQIQQQQAQERSQQPPAVPQQPGTTQTPSAPGTPAQTPTQPGAVPAQTMSREAVLAASPRVRIDTPSLSGSIALKGGRIDDLSLVKYRETVNPNSPPIVLLAPSGSPHPFYAEFGWSAPSGASVKLPGSDTMWRQEGSGALAVGQPVTLTYDNGEGLQFRRTIAVDDNYWAATLLPNTKMQVNAKFSTSTIGNNIKTYQSDYLGPAQTIAPGGTGAVDGRLFAGAKEVSIVDHYNERLGLNKFDRLIDWGWFYFITKPLFLAMDWIYRQVGNFGVAILIITVIIKIFFFPLANKSYASMAKMKAVQPEMMAIRERFADDKVKQQQAMMELYKKEQINPIAGCLPIIIQIPVFFALYKVLFVTIEMRHAPFFGWIKDLSAPDPTTIFNLFGLIPWDPSQVPMLGPFLMLGIWPLIMGVTMWFQMKLNPPPPDPTQAMIFNYMPIIFTFMLASFPAGLVIYWAWNNTLSVMQQSFIMHKHGAKIELWDNLKAMFAKKKPQG